jgi:hypothetical protein
MGTVGVDSDAGDPAVAVGRRVGAVVGVFVGSTCCGSGEGEGAGGWQAAKIRLRRILKTVILDHLMSFIQHFLQVSMVNRATGMLSRR